MSEDLEKVMAFYRRHQWRRCSEELPTENGSYLVLNGHGYLDIDHWRDGEWTGSFPGSNYFWCRYPDFPEGEK
jgi:hypothetical protein